MIQWITQQDICSYSIFARIVGLYSGFKVSIMYICVDNFNVSWRSTRYNPVYNNAVYLLFDSNVIVEHIYREYIELL